MQRAHVDEQTGQVTVYATDAAETVVTTTELVHRAGGLTFEHGYGPPPEVEWPDDYQPGADDDVLWYAETVIRRKVKGHRPFDTTYRGEALVKAGASHAKGGVYACVDLLEKLGTNVVVLDMTPGEVTGG
jgi:hypothetical protein